MKKQPKTSNNTPLVIGGVALGLGVLYLGVQAYANNAVSGTGGSSSSSTGGSSSSGTGGSSSSGTGGSSSSGTGGSSSNGTGGTSTKKIVLPQPYTDFEKQKAVFLSALSKRLCDDYNLDVNYFAFSVGDIKDFYFIGIREEIKSGATHLYKLAGQFQVNFPQAEKEFEQVKATENQVINYLKSVATYE